MSHPRPSSASVLRPCRGSTVHTLGQNVEDKTGVIGSRVTVAQDPLSRYSYVYNQNDQVTKVTSGNVGAAAVVLDSVYDLLGRRTELNRASAQFVMIK